MVSSAYLRLLISLPAILVPVCDSSMPVTRHFSCCTLNVSYISRVTIYSLDELLELTENKKKNCCFEVSPLILCNNNEQFLNQIVTCDKKCILYNNQEWPVQWLNPEEALKHFSKPNLHPKNAHGQCLVVCYLSNPLQLSKTWWNHYIWEVCSANQGDAPKTAMPLCSHRWSTKWAQFFSTTMPDYTSQNQCFKS